MLVNSFFFRTSLPIPSIVKASILRGFGAKVGKSVVIKPNVNIKYPWKLSIGDNTWIGEGVWIDNLAYVSIGANCCISQGAYLLTGNHDFSKSTFDLIIGKINLENGSWIGAKSIVCPGVNIGEHAILSVGSVATKSCQNFGIYQGNPAVYKKSRVINES